MAAPTHYIAKRDLLHSPKSTPATLSATGREYLRRHGYSDALDFFEKARDRDGLMQIKDIALENGDSFLLGRLERFESTLVAAADWERVATVAERRGLQSMAAYAKRKVAPPAQAVPLPAEAPGEKPLEEA